MYEKGREYFSKKYFHGGQTFRKRNLWDVILSGGGNDQIMSRLGRSFINNENFFQ